MSSGNIQQETLHEELDAAIKDNAPKGKLEDAEIQRLVQLSNDASYQRSERVPVKTFEAFEPRSLVSIAMAAQQRRESELRATGATGAAIDEAATNPAETGANSAVETGKDSVTEQPNTDEANALNALPDAAGETTGEAEGSEGVDSEVEGIEDEAASSSQVDFEAGRAEGLEEGRRVGFEEGKAEGMEEGRAAGRAEASAQLERVIQAFEAATSRLSDLTAVDSDALAASINEAVLRIASDRAGKAIAEQPDSFADRIEALLATIRTVSGQPSIRLNPADLASIQPLADTREKLRHCNFVADDALAHGDLSVMVGTIGIDDIIVPPEAAAEDGGETSSDDMRENLLTEAEVLATEPTDAADATDATLAPEKKTVSDSAAADTAQTQDGDQDA
ncbi:MAG: FliH/SctL family protein [Alphaproteobacteria bacterium]